MNKGLHIIHIAKTVVKVTYFKITVQRSYNNYIIWNFCVFFLNFKSVFK